MSLNDVVEHLVEGFVLGEHVGLDQGLSFTQVGEVALGEGVLEVADNLVVVRGGGEEGEGEVGAGDGGGGVGEMVEVEGEGVGGVAGWAGVPLLGGGGCCECACEWDGSDAGGGFGNLSEEGGGSDRGEHCADGVSEVMNE